MPFRRWLPNVSLALAVAAISIPFPVLVYAQQECAPLPYFSPLIERFSIFRILQGGRLARAVAIFNANPPESDVRWQAAYLAIRPDGWGFLMVGAAGTVCQSMRASPDGMEDIVRKIDGVGV